MPDTLLGLKLHHSNMQSQKNPTRPERSGNDTLGRKDTLPLLVPVPANWFGCFGQVLLFGHQISLILSCGIAVRAAVDVPTKI